MLMVNWWSMEMVNWFLPMPNLTKLSGGLSHTPSYYYREMTVAEMEDSSKVSP
jgi:hypothetical protein